MVTAKPDDGDGKAQMGTQLREGPHRSPPVLPVVEIVANVDLDGPEPLEDHLPDETLSGQGRKLAGERLHDHQVHADLVEKFELLVQGGEKPRCPIRIEKLAGVGLEGEDRGFTTHRAGPPDHGPHDRTVPDVETIEVPDGQDAVLERLLQRAAPSNHPQC
jgi:hypothetical protein